MRDLKKNTVRMWYALCHGENITTDESGDETGDPVAIYSKPVSFYANLSPGVGQAQREMFGTNVDFERTISTTQLWLPITENTLIWKETMPKKLADGSVNPCTADYEVTARPARTLNVMVIPVKARAKDGKTSSKSFC